MLVFDKTNRESFTDIDSWMGEVSKHAHENAVKMLIGNKSDLESQVTFEEAKEKADSYGIQYVETSAKEAYQVDTAFTELARELVEKRKECGLPPTQRNSTLALDQPKKHDDKCCY